MSKHSSDRELVRVIFEGEGDSHVNLAETIGKYEDEYYSINVGDKDYNTMEDYLPEYLTEKLALLKLAKDGTSIEGVGYRQLYNEKYSGFNFPREVFYVDINSVGFKQLVKDCKVRRSNREVK